ncbi:hypothetical protein FDA94_19715 [Herbidospora galbida]|uniref:Lipoprotein n=1 Tax=Herbidospora galbida TaxID=2575442 RepID=A0A4U3MGQ7_9ACTN|nr:hypothetical protein [Herbidospora galbida]TKK87016.1 hypothetical protein FDA94_19715 [Herbidospora galbida]
MRSIALLGLALALAACGTVAGEAPGARTGDPVNAAACLEFALAADDLRATARVTKGELRAALRHMDRAVQAANGDVAPLMDDAVLAAEAADPTALATALAAVEGVCRRVGTPIEVPFGY